MKIILRKLDLLPWEKAEGQFWLAQASRWKALFSSPVFSEKAKQQYQRDLERAAEFLGFSSADDLLAYEKIHGKL